MLQREKPEEHLSLIIDDVESRLSLTHQRVRYNGMVNRISDVKLLLKYTIVIHFKINLVILSPLMQLVPFYNLNLCQSGWISTRPLLFFFTAVFFFINTIKWLPLI